MSEETKLAKFRVILSEISNWFNLEDRALYGGIFGKRINDYPKKYFAFQLESGVPCRPSFLDSYNSNAYITLLQKIVGNYPRDKVTAISDIDQIIEIYKRAQKDDQANPFSATAGKSKQSRNQMMFWMLFMAALDDEIYNNELDSIIDIAYCMDFDEAMIRDWCRAVEYVMQGNRLQEGCDFPCETLEGARFFLHKDSSNSVLELLQ